MRVRRLLAGIGLSVVAITACSDGSGRVTLPSSSPSEPSTTVPSEPSTTVASEPSTTVPSERFATLPVGATLPGDAECASRVRRAPETRPGNSEYNQTKGSGPPAEPPPGLYSRVTGDFAGTTDEIIQWAACKWGFDEDLVRAQTAKESYWDQTALGDNGESYGLMQVREPYWGWAFPDSMVSSAYNMDVGLAARRTCYEGYDTWFNSVERGEPYAAGDLWGCVGAWFSGRWHTPAGDEYANAVQQYLADRIWETASFVNHR